jgi:hypothetical protein
MNIKELKESLNEYPDDADVMIAYSSYSGVCTCGDYCYCSPENKEEYISYISPREPQNVKKPKKIEVVLIHCN